MLAKHLAKNIFTKSIKKLPTRDGFGVGLVLAGEQDQRVVVLCADLFESTRAEAFAKKFPDRSWEVGVAEQNLAGVAAGLALGGKIPFMASYAVFSPGRNWDQIRVSIAYNKANVKIIGGHAGLSVGEDGATHQALEDLALMRVLPNLTVIAPADYEEAKKATIAAAKINGPVYIRLTRSATPVFTTAKSSFKIGQADILWESENPQIALVACGPLVYNALEAAKALSVKKIGSIVINCHTIKPLDVKIIANVAKRTGRILTIEEHQIDGGLGGAVAEALAEHQPTLISRIGMPNIFGESGTPEELLKKYGLDTLNIIKKARELIAKS